MMPLTQQDVEADMAQASHWNATRLNQLAGELRQVAALMDRYATWTRHALQNGAASEFTSRMSKGAVADFWRAAIRQDLRLFIEPREDATGPGELPF